MNQLEQIKQAIDRLPEEERCELMEWMAFGRVEETGDHDLDWWKAWEKAAIERMKDAAENPSNRSDANEVHRAIREKYGL